MLISSQVKVFKTFPFRDVVSSSSPRVVNGDEAGEKYSHQAKKPQKPKQLIKRDSPDERTEESRGGGEKSSKENFFQRAKSEKKITYQMKYKHWRKRVSRSRLTGHQCCFILLSSIHHSLSTPPLLYVRALGWFVVAGSFFFCGLYQQQYFITPTWDEMEWKNFFFAPSLNKRIINYSGFFRISFCVFAFMTVLRSLPAPAGARTFRNGKTWKKIESENKFCAVGLLFKQIFHTLKILLHIMERALFLLWLDIPRNAKQTRDSLRSWVRLPVWTR